MPLTSPDFYEVLEVPRRADRRTLARAWRAKRDRVEALRGSLTLGDSEALCAKLDEAFAILSSPRRESRYLEYLRDRDDRSDVRHDPFGGLEFDAAGRTRRVELDTAERNGILGALLDPPDRAMTPWGSFADPAPEPEADAALATPSTEWELDSPPDCGRGPSFEAGARSAFRPNLPAASAERSAKHRAADDRLLRALRTPPWH